MNRKVLRSVAGLLVTALVVSVAATTAAAFVTPEGHPAMPCCDRPDDCAARLSAVSCCAPGQLPDATAPAPVAVSVTIAKVASEVPAGQFVGGAGLLPRAACEAFDLACLKLPHDPPYLRHSVLLI